MTGEGIDDVFHNLGSLIYETSLKKKIKIAEENLKLGLSTSESEKKQCSC